MIVAHQYIENFLCPILLSSHFSQISKYNVPEENFQKSEKSTAYLSESQHKGAHINDYFTLINLKNIMKNIYVY